MSENDDNINKLKNKILPDNLNEQVLNTSEKNFNSCLKNGKLIDCNISAFEKRLDFVSKNEVLDRLDFDKCSGVAISEIKENVPVNTKNSIDYNYKKENRENNLVSKVVRSLDEPSKYIDESMINDENPCEDVFNFNKREKFENNIEIYNEKKHNCDFRNLENSAQLKSTSNVKLNRPTFSKYKQPSFTNSCKELLRKSHSDPFQVANKSHMSTKAHAPCSKLSLKNLIRSSKSAISKCSLTLDGYSYVIFASHPSKNTSEGAVSSPVASTSNNGQLQKQGSLTIVRRSSSKALSENSSKTVWTNEQLLDSVDLESESVPPVDTSDATEKAALRLRVLLRQIKKGEIGASALQFNLKYAIDVLESGILDENKRFRDEEDELSEVEPDAVPPEVREWLASTFTKKIQGNRRKNQEKPKFRSVANAIRAGIFVERIYRRLTPTTTVQLPPEVSKVLKDANMWCFDIWNLNDVCSNNGPLKFISYECFNKYGISHKFKIPPSSLESFLTQVETGYCKFHNPYHNNVHAADVLQTMHYMLSQTGLQHWLSDIEIFATLFAAMIHDLEHNGTTNNFHVMSGSNTALLYNDRAVLENHHISAAFRLLKNADSNILVNLSREEYREFRTLVIDMVLATDMSLHFQQIKSMKTSLSLPEVSLEKSTVLSLILHCCDISHPSKEWKTHERWTRSLLEEFFRQGDKEKELGLAFSPLCDRNNTMVPESQIGFIEFIVEPSLAVCGDLLEKIHEINMKNCNSNVKAEKHLKSQSGVDHRKAELLRPWTSCLIINKNKWRELAVKDAEEKFKKEFEEKNIN